MESVNPWNRVGDVAPGHVGERESLIGGSLSARCGFPDGPHGHNKFARVNDDRTFIWQYDAGIELNLVSELGDGWLFRPLVGLGAGGRTYDYKAVGMGSTTCTAGYGSVGSELQRGIVALRFEARDYLSCYESPVNNAKKTRYDLGLTFGLVYHFR